MYCPHRWGLCEIEQLWSDNLFVANADLMHEKVHDPSYSRSGRGVKTFCGVSVYHDGSEYGLHGIVDCIEARPDAQGLSLVGEEGQYQLCIVEYKPTKPKNKNWNDEDLMQVFAQKLCVDYIFGGDCTAEIYYADVRKRVALPVREEYERLDQKLKETLVKMRLLLEQGKVPPISDGQYCTGCSMKDVCLPTKKGRMPFRRRIQSLIEDNEI